MFDEALLEDADLLLRRDGHRLLWNLATAGAQVRRAVEYGDEFGVARLRDAGVPRALLVATDAPPSAALRLVTRLSCETTPALAWHGVELPRWAGPTDALLIGALDGRHPRLAELAEQGARRGMAMAVVAPAGSPVAAAAGRAPLHELADNLNPHAARWAILTPLLQAVDALGLQPIPPALLAQVADALDETAERCRPTGDLFTNPAKSLALEFAEARPLIVGVGALASVAARATADALQLAAGVGAVAVSLPDGVGRAGALLRGAGVPGGDDFFRDRVDDEPAQRARMLIIGDDGDPADSALGSRTGAQIQLDEVAARRAAAALRRLAEELGVRVSGVDVPDAPPLARFASAAAFGDFTAAYLGFGLGLDPGAPRPAELAH
ncbi:SIS domain-containing protein [Jatrophihabitans sp.]|uniref:SIS domain-containing protein n=1 Tax=Jatrophihabitans sp. TaxID=1932789 RepID=UPI0030C70061|nr:Phospho-glucose isomerase C-terminal protein [Jatrophihabitans sp.]